jgi:segregation and condensation protein B
MSLKAKLEAVIYAAEEPVTLAQFVALFAEEALELKAEREAEAAALVPAPQPTLELVDLPESAEISEIAEPVEVEDLLPGEFGEGLNVEALNAEVLDPESQPIVEVQPDIAPEAAAETANPESGEAADPELEAKRQQRAKDREVREILRSVLDELIAEYAADSRGIEIREIAGGFRMGTKPEIHDAVRAFVKSLKPALKLSLPALETLAVIAYKQPVTAPEVGEIRGVDSGGVLGSLISRKLIATAGRKQVIGRPMLYKTTKEFLLRFGLKDLNELPSMEEFEKMAALELSEGEESEAENQSGDLFAAPATEPASEEKALEEEGPEEPAAEAPEVSTPTAEPSQEAAEAQAPVERQDAEEIEA